MKIKKFKLKALILAVSFIILQLPASCFSSADETMDIVMLTEYSYALVNDKRVLIDNSVNAVAPFVQDGITMIPLEFTALGFGADVKYNETEGMMTVTRASKSVKIWVDSQKISVNENMSKLSAPAVLYLNCVFVSVQDIGEILEKNVFADESGIVVISDSVWDSERLNKAESVILNNLGLIILEDIEKERGKMTDFQVIKSRICSTMYSASVDPLPIMNNMKSDGTFDNINYRDNTPGEWATAKHLDNLLVMGRAYNSIGNPYYRNKELKQKYILGLIHWVENDYINTANTWWQSLGTPPKMIDVLLMKVSGIPDAVLKKAFDICERGDIRVAYTRFHEGEGSIATGGNLTNNCTISLKMAVARGDEEHLIEVLKELENEILIFTPADFTSEGEGVKADYSFHQHLALIYNGLYGYNFMTDIGKMISWLRGTKYMLSEEAVKEYTNFLLDGQQWMFRGVNDDLNVVGRGVAQTTNSTYIAKSLPSVVQTLLSIPDVPRKNELATLLNNRLLGTDYGFSGNRYFWTSDYVSHNRPTYHIGIRSSSTRTKPSEQINGENMQGYYLGDGVTLIQRTGTEYSGTGPVWDWNKIPGTTTPQGALKPLTTSGWYWKGDTNFVGGATNGINGVACMDYSKDGLTARKAWFMFDEGLVALGAGINYPGTFPVNTSVNQCVLRSDVEIKTKTRKTTVEKGVHDLENVSWVLQDGIGYWFPENQKLTLHNNVQTGKMSNISQYASASEVNLDIFNLWIDHGSRVNNSKYAYMVLPEVTSEQLDEFEKARTIQIVENSADVQAVWSENEKILEAIFWKAGSIAVKGGITVRVDKPCAILVQERDECLEIAVSNPLHTADTVTVTINRKIDSKWAKISGVNSSVAFDLPTGNFSGSTVLFDTQRGFWEKTNYNRYNEQIKAEEKPKLMGITINGNPLKNFNQDITGYKVPLNIENQDIPKVQAFGRGKIDIVADKNTPKTIMVSIENPEVSSDKSVYSISFYVTSKEGEPDNATTLKIEGVLASDIPQPENSPENTIDGIVADYSRWSATGENVWIQYDLGSTKDVDYIAVAAAFGDARSTSFSISTSEDGEHWMEVYNGATSGSTSGFETYPIQPSQARYVRIYGYGSTVSAWTSITEVKIYSANKSLGGAL